MKVKSKIWFENEEDILISYGKIKLLKLIVQTGSISQAAKEMEMSLNKARKLVDQVNKANKKPLIETQVGGKDGGGTRLTKYGHQIIDIYEKIERSCWQFLDEEIKKYKI